MRNDVRERTADLIADFEVYLETEPPFGDWAWHLHRETIDMRKQFRSVADATESYEFIVKHIGYTLVAWGMDGRAAELAPREDFFTSIKEHRRHLVELERFSVSDLTSRQLDDFIWKLIQGLGLSKGRSQVVTGSKVLHHLFPKLMPPIDRQYTAKFFTPEWLKNTRDPNSKSQFMAIANGFGSIATVLEKHNGEDYLRNLVGATQWATSETKLIDNAIIGYVKKHNL